MFSSVRTRLTFWYAGVLALSLITFAVVVYYAATDDRLQINPSNLGGWGPGWGWATGSTVVAPLENIRDGDLAVAIAIVRTKRFIWTGSASGSMSGGARRVQKRLDGSLDKMFQKFPLRPQT